MQVLALIQTKAKEKWYSHQSTFDYVGSEWKER